VYGRLRVREWFPPLSLPVDLAAWRFDPLGRVAVGRLRKPIANRRSWRRSWSGCVPFVEEARGQTRKVSALGPSGVSLGFRPAAVIADDGHSTEGRCGLWQVRVPKDWKRRGTAARRWVNGHLVPRRSVFKSYGRSIGPLAVPVKSATRKFGVSEPDPDASGVRRRRRPPQVGRSGRGAWRAVLVPGRPNLGGRAAACVPSARRTGPRPGSCIVVRSAAGVPGPLCPASDVGPYRGPRRAGRRRRRDKPETSGSPRNHASRTGRGSSIMVRLTAGQPHRRQNVRCGLQRWPAVPVGLEVQQVEGPPTRRDLASGARPPARRRRATTSLRRHRPRIVARRNSMGCGLIADLPSAEGVGRKPNRALGKVDRSAGGVSAKWECGRVPTGTRPFPDFPVMTGNPCGRRD
jgi:hypothetical protein